MARPALVHGGLAQNQLERLFALVLEANPQVGDRYHQEEYRDVAEDQARVLRLTESACVPYKDAKHPDGCFDNLVLTWEWSRFAPGVVDNKYYAENVGFILGVMVEGRVPATTTAKSEEQDRRGQGAFSAAGTGRSCRP